MSHAVADGLRRLPLFPSLKGYRREWLRGDIVAGLTVWAVLVPEALAYATVAGVSPVVGLYAAPGALLFYAAFGSSRHLIVGPMSATAALSAATVSQFAAPGDDAYLMLTTSTAIVVGVIAIGAAIVRLGFVANFISEPVLKGFIIGLALTIMAGQLPSLIGVEDGEGNFFEKVWDTLEQVGDLNGWTAVIGIASLALVLGLRRIAPRVPASLVAVAFGVGSVLLLNLDEEGVSIVGQIDSGFPDLGLPAGVSGSDLLNLAAGAIGALLVGFAEGLGAAKGYAVKNGYEVDPDAELLGLGAANLAAGLSGGMVVNGSLSKTAVNGGAGASSQVSGLVVAALAVPTFLFLTGLFEELPEATLAAIVIGALIELVDIPALVRLYRIHSSVVGPILGPAARADFFGALAALLGVLLFDTLPGLFIGIAASMILLVYRAYRPRIAILGRVAGTDQFADVSQHAENQQIPGVVIARVESGLFFANAERVHQEVLRLAARDGVKAVLLDAEAMPFVDLSAAEMLVRLAETLHGEGKKLLLARDIGQVRELISLAKPEETIETYPTVRQAVERLEAEGR
jgi:high affinity sulfate transporter 1